MDFSLDAAIGRYCRAVLATTKGNKKEACRLLGISDHTFRKYERVASDETDVPIAKVRESTSEQLLRLHAALPNVAADVLMRELLIAESRGAAAQARQTIAHLRSVAGVDAPTLTD